MAYTDKSPSSAEASSRWVDPTVRMHLYFQGFLDDACLLYALANAYKALTGKRVTREHWKRAITQLPDPAAFLGGPGATELRVGEDARLIGDILGAYSDPGETFTLERLSQSAGIADFCSAISIDSVVVFAYGGPTEFSTPRRTSCAASQQAPTRRPCTLPARRRSPAAICSMANTSSAIIRTRAVGPMTQFPSITGGDRAELPVASHARSTGRLTAW